MRRVLDATLVLAQAGGFDAVQMRDVATEADVALGTVYRYFNSKERLILEMMIEQLSGLARYVDSHQIPGGSAAERVCSVLAGSNASLARYPDVALAMVRSFGASREENADVVRRVSTLMTGIITAAIGADTTRANQVARIITQVWLSSLIGWAGGVDPITRVDEDLGIASKLLLA